MKTWQVIFLDGHLECPLLDPVWKEVFSPQFPILRASDFQRKQVCFSHVVFSLPGYQSLLSVDLGAGNSCQNSALVKEFSHFMLDSYGLLSKSGPISIPEATLVVRKDYSAHPRSSGRISRKFQNEEELVKIGHEVFPYSHFKVADLATMSFREQLELMQSTNILIGVHGAGLTQLLFLPDESIVIEFGDGTNRHFRNMAKWANKIYINGGSFPRTEWVQVVPDQFRSLLKFSRRVASSFGTSLFLYE